MSQQTETIRVLRIINRFNLGGPTFNVAYLTAHMDAPFETKLVGGMRDDSEASSEFILDELGIQPTIVSEMRRSISPKADVRAYKEIAAIIRDYRPHIVHTHASKAGTLGRIAAYYNNVPIILHTFHGHVFHSYFGGFKTRLFKGIERWLAGLSTRIIAISEIQRKELTEEHGIAPKEKVEVVPLGFDLSRFDNGQTEKREDFRTSYGLEENDVAIGIVGRLVPIKNHGMFIEAAKAVAEKHPHARFFIIGGGELMQELQEKCRSVGIGFTVESAPTQQQPLVFTSWIQDIDRAMAGMDMVALTSLNEGTPVSLIEAQAARKPVISTRVGGIEDIVLEGTSALLCDKGDVKQLTTHMGRLVTDAQLRSTMGAAGHDHVMERYSYKRLVNDMQSLYLRLLEEKDLR